MSVFPAHHCTFERTPARPHRIKLLVQQAIGPHSVPDNV